jgi:hypothetical protein
MLTKVLSAAVTLIASSAAEVVIVTGGRIVETPRVPPPTGRYGRPMKVSPALLAAIEAVAVCVPGSRAMTSPLLALAFETACAIEERASSGESPVFASLAEQETTPRGPPTL